MSAPEQRTLGTPVGDLQVGSRVSRGRLLEIISAIGKVMTVSGSLQAVMDVVAEECARLTRADGATIFMVENQRLTAKSAVGALGFASLEMPLGNSLPSHAVMLRRAVRSGDTGGDDPGTLRRTSHASARSSVSAPFIFGSSHDIAGVLHVASQSQDAFTEEDEETIQIFADLVGSAIQNARQFDQAMRESREDALTELLNRRAFEEHARMLKKEQVNHKQPYCLILFDVDGLKLINDRYGHQAGDEALRMVALSARLRVRKSDIVYRLGGDEFAVLLPQTTLLVAEEVARRIETAVAERSTHGRWLSVSTGTCEAGPSESVPLLIARTDQIMYMTKRSRPEEEESDPIRTIPMSQLGPQKSRH